MTDREALLRAIIENPDDDAPRLVYADWLDEHGEPERAEFIRLQIELFNGSKTIDETWYDRAEVIATRVLELEAEFGLGWLGRFQNGEPVSDWYYERGFVRDIDAGPRDTFLTDGGALFESHPIESLRPGEVPIGDIVQLPWLSRLRELDLSYAAFASADLAILAASNLLPSLERLDLSSSALTDAGVHALLSGPLLRQIRSLNLSRTSISQHGADLLAESSLVGKVEELDVRDCSIGMSGQRALRRRFGPRLSE